MSDGPSTVTLKAHARRGLKIVIEHNHAIIYIYTSGKKFSKKIKGSRTEWVNLTHLKVKKQDSYVICGANETCNVSRVFTVLHACIL